MHQSGTHGITVVAKNWSAAEFLKNWRRNRVACAPDSARRHDKTTLLQSRDRGEIRFYEISLNWRQGERPLVAVGRLCPLLGNSTLQDAGATKDGGTISTTSSNDASQASDSGEE